MDKKELAIVAVITFIVVAVWIASAIISTRSTIPDNPKLTVLLKNLNPNFDTALLDQITNLPEVPRSQKVLLSTPTSTTSATQTATSGGSLR